MEWMAPFAVWQIVEVWNHGEIFADRRSALSAWSDRESRWALSRRLRGFVGGVSSCPWCLSVWVGWLVMLLLYFCGTPGLIIVGGLGSSRVANLLNDLTHDACRTPKSDKIDFGDGHEPDGTDGRADEAGDGGTGGEPGTGGGTAEDVRRDGG